MEDTRSSTEIRALLSSANAELENRRATEFEPAEKELKTAREGLLELCTPEKIQASTSFAAQLAEALTLAEEKKIPRIKEIRNAMASLDPVTVLSVVLEALKIETGIGHFVPRYYHYEPASYIGGELDFPSIEDERPAHYEMKDSVGSNLLSTIAHFATNENPGQSFDYSSRVHYAKSDQPTTYQLVVGEAATKVGELVTLFNNIGNKSIFTHERKDKQTSFAVEVLHNAAGSNDSGLILPALNRYVSAVTNRNEAHANEAALERNVTALREQSQLALDEEKNAKERAALAAAM